MNIILYIFIIKLDLNSFISIEIPFSIQKHGSGALNGNMLLVRNIENNRIDAYL